MFGGLLPATTRRQESTLYALSALGDAVYDLRLSEMSKLWPRVKDTYFLWAMAERAMRARGVNPEHHGFMRLAAMFCAAGFTPGPEAPIGDDTRRLLGKIAFMIYLLRSLRDGGMLQTMESRPSWAVGNIVHSYVRHLPYEGSLTVQERSELTDVVAQAIAGVVSCRHGNIKPAFNLVGAMKAWHFRPGDFNLTQVQVDAWHHERLVRKVDEFRTYCTEDLDSHSLFANVKGVLVPLTRGVRLEETGVTRAELVSMRERLETFLSAATSDPDHFGLRLTNLSAFRADVMPLFDQILGEPSGT